MLRKLSFVLPVFALLLASGCGDDATGPNDSTDGPGSLAPGNFSAQITGAVNTSLTGVARFSSSTSGDGSFALVLAALGPDGLMVARNQHGRPANGSHPIGDTVSQLFGGTDFWGSITVAGGMYQTDDEASGTVTITQSSANRLSGTLQVEAGDPDGGRVTVTASFQATCGAPDDCS